MRDEDIRLSFLYGNYTTLTSITEDEMGRVVEQRLTPQYVSVHATDLDVRAYLLGIDKARADISAKLRRLIDARIEIHAQVVLCPGINDGEVLRRTIYDLAADYPNIKSVAIVPLGLTRYNEDARLTPVTAEFCRQVVRELKPVQDDLRARTGTNFAFLGDEIYLRAGLDVPSRRHYGDYPQIEDGVGMVRSFYEDFQKLWRKLERRPPARPEKLHGTILTGTLFAPIMQKLVARVNERFQTRLHVVAVENDYFGSEIVVAGLMTGACVVKTRAQIAGEFVVIPSAAFKSDDAVMLDGTTHATLAARLGLPVHALDFAGLSRLLLSTHL